MKSAKTFLLYFKFPIGQLDSDKAFDVLMEFEDILRQIVESENLGEVDGHEFCYGEDEESITFFIYTTDEKNSVSWYNHSLHIFRVFQAHTF